MAGIFENHCIDFRCRFFCCDVASISSNFPVRARLGGIRDRLSGYAGFYIFHSIPDIYFGLEFISGIFYYFFEET